MKLSYYNPNLKIQLDTWSKCWALPLMTDIHTRMPLIIHKLDEEAWLTSSNPMHVSSLLKPYPAESMDEVTVSREVNKGGNDGVELVEEFFWEI